MLIIDFETRSEIDLKQCGADVYAAHPSTDILCLCAKDFNTGEEFKWLAAHAMPEAFTRALEAAPLLMAVNARFDQAIYEFIGVDYDLPEKRADQWYCVGAQFAVNALPQSLDKATRALGSKHRKNPNGAKLIRLLSCPPFEGTGDTTLMNEMLMYCMDDVRATHEAMKRCRLMTQDEHSDWLLNERINDRGVGIDTELAELAQGYAEHEAQEIASTLLRLTNGRVMKHTQTARLIAWLLDEMPDHHHLITDHSKKSGYSVAKNVRELLLSTDALPEHVREVVRLVDDATASSVSKFKRMQDMAQTDGRVRGSFIYYGASQTGRYSSKGLQLHNMSRECLSPEQTEEIKLTMQSGGMLPDLMKTLRGMLRPAIIPAEGKVFGVSDWSAIEARLLPWLANTRSADEMLDVFKRGDDVYVHTAKSMGKHYSRQIGKVATLALGYQGGLGAFNSMAVNYGVILPDAEVSQIVNDWREANSWAVRFWAQLEAAAMQAFTCPATHVKAGRVTYYYLPKLINGTLICTLPDGSSIQYPNCRAEKTITPWGDTRNQLSYLKASLTPKADATAWPRASLYGGLLAENICQATSAALLRHAIRECEKENLMVVAHTHDEMIVELETDLAQYDLPRLKEVMTRNPEWAEGLPLDASADLMVRYGK